MLCPYGYDGRGGESVRVVSYYASQSGAVVISRRVFVPTVNPPPSRPGLIPETHDVQWSFFVRYLAGFFISFLVGYDARRDSPANRTRRVEIVSRCALRLACARCGRRAAVCVRAYRGLKCRDRYANYNTYFRSHGLAYGGGYYLTAAFSPGQRNEVQRARVTLVTSPVRFAAWSPIHLCRCWLLCVGTSRVACYQTALLNVNSHSQRLTDGYRRDVSSRNTEFA